MDSVSIDLSKKKENFRVGLFTSMAIFFISGVVGFFILTGYRLKLILNAPILFMAMVFLTIISFYMASFSRKLAINTNQALDFFELKMITIEYFKKFILRFGLPFNFIIGYFYSYFKYNYLLLIIAAFWICFVIMIFSERKILFMKLDQ